MAKLFTSVRSHGDSVVFRLKILTFIGDFVLEHQFDQILCYLEIQN